MKSKTQKFLIATIFLIVSIFTGVIGVLTLNLPKLEGGIGVSFIPYEARINRGEYYTYYDSLSSAVLGSTDGDTIEIINQVNLNSLININKNLTFNSMVLPHISTSRNIEVNASGSGKLVIGSGTSVNFGDVAGLFNFSTLSTVTGSLIEVLGNLTVNGGVYSSVETSGNGAVFKVNTGGTLTVKSGIFENNEANDGGVIYNEGILNIESGIFKNNQADNGGIIYNEGTVNLQGGTFENNTATNGSGIYNNGTLNISKSPYIDDEIYLPTGKFINFNAESWIKPLKIATQATSGQIKIAEKASGLSEDLTTKFDDSIISGAVTEEDLRTTYLNHYVSGESGESFFTAEDNELFIEVELGDLVVIPMTEGLTFVTDQFFATAWWVREYTGSQKDIVIPNYYGGTSGTDVFPVTAVYGSVSTPSFGALRDKQLTSVLLPSTITNIMGYAFYNNYLGSIIIPSSVTTIANYAFSGNNGLVEVTIDSSTVAAGLSSLTAQGNLIEKAQVIYIKDNITTIGSWVTSNFMFVQYVDKPGYSKYANTQGGGGYQ